MRFENRLRISISSEREEKVTYVGHVAKVSQKLVNDKD